MTTERALAVTGLQAYASNQFEHHESVLNAGVLLSIPALISQGLEKIFEVLKPLPSGFYGLHHMILLLCYMALCRIKNPEQLKQYPPGELGKLLGLDRIPEHGYFRTKLQQIIKQGKGDELHKEFFKTWSKEMSEAFFYIDGHVRVYHGDLANLPKRFVSREKLCMSGTTEYWVNTQEGLPLLIITGELNEGIKSAIKTVIPKILEENPHKGDANTPAFTLVFDREAYEPVWFNELWQTHKVAVITYRKNVKDKWDESAFKNIDVKIFNTTLTMQLCDKQVSISGHSFREIRKISEGGHQTSILTTHPSLKIEIVAEKMFARWSQENFFKYMTEDFDFDRMIEYGKVAVSNTLSVVNPEYRVLTNKIKKCTATKQRLEAKILLKMENNLDQNITDAMKAIAQSCDFIEDLNICRVEIQELKAKRKSTKTHITIADMPEESRFNKLKQEGKKIKNLILMLAYRAESAMYNTLNGLYKNVEKDGRMLLKEIFKSDADMIPDYLNKTLTIKVHSLSSPRANEALTKLCAFLNETETIYPDTNLKIIYKSILSE